MGWLKKLYLTNDAKLSHLPQPHVLVLADLA